MSNKKEPQIKRVECGICDKSYTNKTIVGVAKAIAKHWNQGHGDELSISEKPFKTEQYGGEHLHGNEYSYRVVEYYITAYDVLDTSGHSCGPFAYEYVKEPEAVDHCEDCWQSIEEVDGYRELPTDGWRDKYLCDECNQKREIERHKEENQQITEFAQ